MSTWDPFFKDSKIDSIANITKAIGPLEEGEEILRSRQTVNRQPEQCRDESKPRPTATKD